MTLTVSVSQFRNNMADYLDKVIAGNRILIRDEKKDVAIAELTKTKSFDKDAFERTLRKAAGVFTAKNHPEWRTKTDVINWVRKNRLANQRSF
ncbi:MAG: hypothetical protein HW400_715 [Candidatus Levybacteria bacterium]|nr:hypothetical protein [Candidatus Levybacteria bacterium]